MIADTLQVLNREGRAPRVLEGLFGMRAEVRQEIVKIALDAIRLPLRLPPVQVVARNPVIGLLGIEVARLVDFLGVDHGRLARRPAAWWRAAILLGLRIPRDEHIDPRRVLPVPQVLTEGV